MKGNYRWGFVGSIVCHGTSVIDTRTNLEAVRIDYTNQDEQLMVARAAAIVRALNKIDRERESRYQCRDIYRNDTPA